MSGVFVALACTVRSYADRSAMPSLAAPRLISADHGARTHADQSGTSADALDPAEGHLDLG